MIWADPSQLVCCKPMVPREHQRVQPELAGTPLSFYVDVRRFVAIEAGEEEPIWSGVATDAWHSGAPVLPSRFLSDISWPAANVLRLSGRRPSPFGSVGPVSRRPDPNAGSTSCG